MRSGATPGPGDAPPPFWPNRDPQVRGFHRPARIPDRIRRLPRPQRRARLAESRQQRPASPFPARGDVRDAHRQIGRRDNGEAATIGRQTGFGQKRSARRRWVVALRAPSCARSETTQPISPPHAGCVGLGPAKGEGLPAAGSVVPFQRWTGSHNAAAEHASQCRRSLAYR